jgi:hypothetical protein
MKHPLLELIKLIFIFAATCSIGMAVSIWLITRDPISPIEYVRYGIIGAIGGVWIGVGVWFVFYLQIRRYNRK